MQFVYRDELAADMYARLANVIILPPLRLFADPAALAVWTTEGWIQEQHPCLCGKESTLDVCRSANVYVQTQLLFEQINGIYSTRDFVLRVIGKGIIVVLYPFQILCSFEKPPIILHMAVDVKVGNLVL